MNGATLLTLNAGSSSIKFALYRTAADTDDGDAEPEELARGQVENLGPVAALRFARRGERGARATPIGAADHAVALGEILERSRGLLGDAPVAGVGHRIVHGGVDFVAPRVLDEATLARLRALTSLAPLHQPHNLAAVAAARNAFPDALQLGCFDTAFHRGHPWVNDTFALPRRYYDRGVRRYGFHGLSYQYTTGELERLAPELARGRVVIAHLGNGASMCAIHHGQSVASTMGFSALDGLPMGTRCGQLDPGVLLYLLDQERLSTAQLADLLYRESGLKGLSGLSHDMRELEASGDPHAAQAIDYFVFRIRRELGAMAAVLGGLDALVFCGGIGENSARLRREVCDGLNFLGVELAAEARALNGGGASEIGAGRVRVLVIPTDEERVIARALARALSGRPG